MVSLGINIDHIATLRNARGGPDPDPIAAALLAEAHGADGITAHLREDRRHITDADIWGLHAAIKTRLNMEMAATEEMIGIACQLKPYMCTLVPERRQELTTEGGLDVAGQLKILTPKIQTLLQAGILVSLFIDADSQQLYASQQTGATLIELHTGRYAETFKPAEKTPALTALQQAAHLAASLGLGLNAGHGLNYINVKPVAALPGMQELNIGHNIIARAAFVGLGQAVSEMKALLPV